MSSHVFDRQAWSKMDVNNQMGNIGSEVGRALSAKRRGKAQWMEGAFYRGLDLIDETTKLWVRDKRPGLKELLYAREMFAEAILTDHGQDEWLEEYFMQYALAARAGR